MRLVAPLFLFLACLSAAPADDAVTVTAPEPVVERKEFDPAHPPAEMKPLDHGEEAYTSWQFSAAMDVDYTLLSDQPRGKGWAVAMKINKARMKVGAKFVIYLPPGAPERLKQHEEGHRLVADHYYQDARALGAAAARPVIGQVFRAEGADRDAAIHAAILQVVERACGGYLKVINDRADRANVIYDDLTDHGRRAKPTADEAVVAAVERADKHASTKDTK